MRYGWMSIATILSVQAFLLTLVLPSTDCGTLGGHDCPGHVLDSDLFYHIEWRTEYQALDGMDLMIENFIVDAEGNSYIPVSDGRLVSVNGSGSIRWQFNGSGDPSLNVPILLGGNVLYTSSDGLLYCLSCSNGSLVWSCRVAEVCDWISDPVPGIDGEIVVITSRKVLTWVGPNGSIARTVYVGGDFLVNELHVDDEGNSYLSTGMELLSYDRNGTLRWSYDDKVGLFNYIVGDTSGRIVGACYLGKMVCLTRDAQEVWSSELEKGMISELTPGRNGSVYVLAELTDAGTELISMAGDGSCDWRVSIPHSPSRPYIDKNGDLLIGGRSEMVRLDDLTGSVMWSRNLWEGVNPIPISTDRYLTLDRQGRLICTRGYVCDPVDHFYEDSVTYLGVFLPWFEPKRTLYPVEYYEVLEMDDFDGKVLDRHITTMNNYFDTDFEYNTTVYYEIVAHTKGGVSPPSNEFVVHIGQGGGEYNHWIEVALENMTVKIELFLFPSEWLSDLIYQFKVMRMDERYNVWEEIGELDPYLMSYVDEDPIEDTTSYYRVDLITYDGRRVLCFPRYIHVPAGEGQEEGPDLWWVAYLVCGGSVWAIVVLAAIISVLVFRRTSRSRP